MGVEDGEAGTTSWVGFEGAGVSLDTSRVMAVKPKSTVGFELGVAPEHMMEDCWLRDDEQDARNVDQNSHVYIRRRDDLIRHRYQDTEPTMCQATPLPQVLGGT